MLTVVNCISVLCPTLVKLLKVCLMTLTYC
jgi:hypothetical protein